MILSKTASGLLVNQYRSVLMRAAVACAGVVIMCPSFASDAQAVLEKLSGDTTSSVHNTNVAAAYQTFSVIGSHLSGGSILPSAGVSSGDCHTWEQAAVWGHSLYNKTRILTDDGFDSKSVGMAVGGEYHFTKHIKMGLGYSYTDTDIDTDSRSTNAKTNSAILYGEYKNNSWFVNGIASYSFGQYSEDAGLKTANFDADSYAAQILSGYDFYLRGADITPTAGLRYVNVDTGAYTDSVGSRFNNEDTNVLTGVLGGTVASDFIMDNAVVFRPELKMAITYDFINDSTRSLVALANGAAFEINGASVEELGLEAGAGIGMRIYDSLELGVSYEGKFKKDYYNHSAMLNAKVLF